jgi:hypothetical protein
VQRLRACPTPGLSASTVAAPVRFLAWSEWIERPKLRGHDDSDAEPRRPRRLPPHLREQLAGDQEHLRDLQAGASVRTPEVYGLEPTRARVALAERLAEDVGGLYYPNER